MTSMRAETFRSILTLKEFFLLTATRKKHKNNSNESDFSENQIQDLKSSEAVVQKCSVKKVFLEILQKSQ